MKTALKQSKVSSFPTSQTGHKTSQTFARRSFLTASGIGAILVSLRQFNTAGAGQMVFDPILQPATPDEMAFIERAFEMRQHAIDYGDQAYGAIIVRDNIIIGQSWSRVILDEDPTAHAEMSAIRDAAVRVDSRDLSGAIMYSSSSPCPMCEAAAYWAGIDQLTFGSEVTNGGSPNLC
jgi:tRNA(Arg) A34 adenosine deaminase TadA